MLYTDVIGPILAQAEGCPRVLAVQALRDTCIHFCSESRWLTTGSQVVLDGTQVPSFDLNVQVLDICEARIGGEPVYVTYLNDPEGEEDCLPEGYTHSLRFADPNNPVLTPAATVDAPVTLDLVLCIAPGPESTEIQVDLWRRFSEALKSGAIARLLALPKKLWSDADGASYHGGIYAAALATATSEASRNRAQPGRRLRSKPV